VVRERVDNTKCGGIIHLRPGSSFTSMNVLSNHLGNIGIHSNGEGCSCQDDERLGIKLVVSLGDAECGEEATQRDSPGPVIDSQILSDT
jgi:hypothetical protein